MTVLDTHVAVWWTQEPEHLSEPARRAIDNADRLLLPAIVFWEVALLVRKKRLRLKRDQSVVEWAEQVLTIPRVMSVPLTHELAIEADGLSMHSDPADRFIAATSLRYHAKLVTKDTLLSDLDWLATVW